MTGDVEKGNLSAVPSSEKGPSRDGAQGSPNRRGPPGLHSHPGFKAPMAACTHLAWSFRACSMFSRAPTYWGEKVGVSQVPRITPIRPEEGQRQQKAGLGQGGAGKGGGAGKKRRGQLSRRRGQKSPGTRAEVAGGRDGADRKGRDQNVWWGGGDRPSGC